MVDAAELIRWIEQNYPLTNIAPRGALATKGLREAHVVEASQGSYVVKLTEPGRAEEVIRADTGALGFLEAHGFPAPRLLRARRQEVYLPWQDRFVYLYRYLEGKHPTPALDFMRRAGKILARLHCLPADGFAIESGYTPQAILGEVERCLNQALEGEQRALAEKLLERAQTFPDLGGLPRGVIHTDPYLVNWIEDRNENLFLIDWDDAGVGVPLLDVGYCAIHLSTYPRHEALRWGVPAAGNITCRKDWAYAFLAGYQSARPLSRAERELLPAAMELSVLAYVWDWDAQRLIEENIERAQLAREFTLEPDSCAG